MLPTFCCYILILCCFYSIKYVQFNLVLKYLFAFGIILFVLLLLLLIDKLKLLMLLTERFNGLYKIYNNHTHSIKTAESLR